MQLMCENVVIPFYGIYESHEITIGLKQLRIFFKLLF